MNLLDLQTRLRASGRYIGALDGLYGPKTKAAIILAMTDGPDTALTDADFTASAARQSVDVPAIKTVASVEANGAGFYAGMPKILFEPHIFSKKTGHRFDDSHPVISYPNWGTRKYPGTQSARYDQLCEAVSLDVDAGFSAASYGKFQILGDNYAACGFDSPFAFAEAMARDEPTQLLAFERFLKSAGLLDALRRHDWATFARGYNGPAYRQNGYDTALAQAFKAAGGV